MSSPKKTALVASSDVKIRELVREALVAEGCEPILCGDGEEALESLKAYSDETPILLAILDAYLPKADGFQLVKHLEQTSTAKETPVLMLIDSGRDSGRVKPTDRLRADDYLKKPFEPGEIRQRVHSMVHHFRAHGQPHPLTGLGGHPQTEEELYNRFNRGETVTMVWIDINYFRPFNDHYGREKGDQVIREMVQMIRETLSSVQIPSEQKYFLAQIDGDDFILLVPESQADQIRNTLRQKFHSEISKFYSKEEREKGFIYQKDRNRQDQIFPLMSLSTLTLKVEANQFAHYGELVSKANELLHQAKIGAQETK